LGIVARSYSQVRVEGLDRLPGTAAVLCFSHQNWIDPLYVLCALPARPRIHFFGPEQPDMRVGTRNRLMRWAGLVVPFRPGRRGLVAAMARASSLAKAGNSIAIAGEGRIHCGEGTILPLRDGAAYLSLRAGIPLVPVAINGTGWLGFRRVVRVRLGPPLEVAPATTGRPAPGEIAHLSERAQAALQGLVSDFPAQISPGPVGRWLTELFNSWPEGSRPCDNTE
jgi:1-acyl-sn-glycerol-3-phosphate acyltransferase